VQFAPVIAPADGDGWATTSELAGPQLDAGLALCGASLNTDRPDIQGQRLVEIVTWRLAVPAAAALLSDTELPDLSADNVLVWIGDEPPDGNGIATRSSATRPRTDLEEIRSFLAHEHLAPLVDAVNTATKRPTRALWRSADDRIAAAIAWIAQTTGATVRAFELLDGKAELRWLDLGTHELLLHVREGCCLYYRTPVAVKCFSCPLLDDDARRRLVAGGG
jgi:ferric iron reductase protein FhuF